MADTGDVRKKKTSKPAARTGSGKGLNLSTARLKRMIKKLMDTLEKEDNSTKASVGELLKLLQVYKDLTAEQVKEVEVRWVDRLRVDEESGT